MQFVGPVGSGSLWRFGCEADAKRVFRGHSFVSGAFSEGLYLYAADFLIRVTPSLASAIAGKATGRVLRVLEGAVFQ